LKIDSWNAKFSTLLESSPSKSPSKSLILEIQELDDGTSNLIHELHAGTVTEIITVKLGIV